MKILFVIQNMKMGGVQRSLINLTKELLNMGYEIEYLILDYSGSLLDNIPNEVSVLLLPKKYQNICRLYQETYKEIIKKKNILDILIKVFLSVIKKMNLTSLIANLMVKNVFLKKQYEAIISFDGIPALADDTVLAIKNDCLKICWIHSDIKAYKFSPNMLKRHYSHFDRIGIVSNACKKNLIEMFPELENKSFTIYNMFNSKEIINKSLETLPIIMKKQGICFLSVARMHEESKKISRIIHAVSLLNNEGYTNFCVYLVGNGPNLDEYKHQVKLNKLEHIVLFLGEQKNPYPYMKNADVFIMSSNFEGFPMTLKEALILGTPCITTNFSAATEVIKNKITGLITMKSVDGMYQSMKYILDYPEKLIYFRENISLINNSNKISINQFQSMIKERSDG